jgi:ubiquinone/menaquinone biosynthesis C-methylase UbiE
MAEEVAAHYSANAGLVEKITKYLRDAGKDLTELKATDMAAVDEFHFRGREATLELAGQMRLSKDSLVLDIGSGLGGPARTLAGEYGCHVTGLDLTQAYCDAAIVMSDWVNLSELTKFQQGDATNLPFADDHFDAAISIHVAMNIPAKDRLYEQARRVVKPGGIFAVYDILQGDGGDVSFPVPWARDSSINHLTTPEEMQELLCHAGFKILKVHDSSNESQGWFEPIATRVAQLDSPLVSSPTQVLFGDDFATMASNQIRGLRERQIQTVSFICEA